MHCLHSRIHVQKQQSPKRANWLVEQRLPLVVECGGGHTPALPIQPAQISKKMANKLTESYLLAWLRWHSYRRFRSAPCYRTMWRFRKYLRKAPPGGLLVDCGANVGDLTRLFLEKGFTVHAFEPDPTAAAELKRRYGADPRVTIHVAAVGASARKQKLFRAESGSLDASIGSSLFQRPILQHTGSVDVEVIDLFAFLRSLGRFVDVLKLDIEGGEAEILERMLDERAYLSIGRVYVETHDAISPQIAASIQRSRNRIAAERIANVDLGWL